MLRIQTCKHSPSSPAHCSPARSFCSSLRLFLSLSALQLLHGHVTSIYPLPHLLLFPPLSIYHPHSSLLLPPPPLSTRFIFTFLSLLSSLSLSNCAHCLSVLPSHSSSLLLLAPTLGRLEGGGFTEGGFMVITGCVCVCVCACKPSIHHSVAELCLRWGQDFGGGQVFENDLSPFTFDPFLP